MTPLEIIAVIMVVLIAIKFLVLAVKPRAWMKVCDAIYGNPKATTWVGLILGAVILYYLLQELTIVQIFATLAFLSALMMIGIANFSKDLNEFAKKILARKNIMKKTWLAWVIWLVLMAWALKEIFM